MNILILPLFVSFILVVGAMLCYLRLAQTKEFEHQDESSLIPLEDD